MLVIVVLVVVVVIWCCNLGLGDSAKKLMKPEQLVATLGVIAAKARGVI